MANKFLEKIAMIRTPAKKMKKKPKVAKKRRLQSDPPRRPKRPQDAKISLGALRKINSSRKSL